jgi:hypothetical protein
MSMKTRYPKVIVTSTAGKRSGFHDVIMLTQFSSDAYFRYLYNMSTHFNPYDSLPTPRNQFMKAPLHHRVRS